jgi:uncharacterized membrane protein YhfC
VLTTSLIVQLVLFGTPPIIVGFWLNRRLGLSWFLFMAGALAFVVSWTITIFVPSQLNLLVSSIAQMGVLYLIYRFWLNMVSTEREALMVGAGQGGLELILLSVFAAMSLLQVSQLRNATDDTLASLVTEVDDIAEEDVQPARIAEMRESIDDFWNSAWYGPVIQPIQSFVRVLPLRYATDDRLVDLIEEVNDLPEEEIEPERITDLRQFIDSFWNAPWYAAAVHPVQALAALPIQIALSVIVLGALTHRRWQPLIGAMAVHLLSRLLPLYGQLFGGMIAWLAITVLFGFIAIWFLIRLWPTVQQQAKADLSKQGKTKTPAKQT